MLRVGVDETLSPQLLHDFPPEAEIVRIPRHATSTHDIDFWILTFVRKDAVDTFKRLRGVQVIQSMMAGVDWITPWLPPGVTLCDGRGIHDISTSEWVLSVILASLKRLPLFRDLQHQQQWTRELSGHDSFLEEDERHTGQYHLLGEDLSGKTILIVGYGSIGAAIESRLTPFGVNILRLARSARTLPPSAPGEPSREVHPFADLHTLLPQADIVILTVPLTPETQGLIGAPELALMRRGALLVNAARGPVVQTDALVDALNEHRIRAALDVTDPEPLPPEHPLWSTPNTLITPHVGGSTPEFIHRAFHFGAAQVRRYLDGQPLENIVGKGGY